MPDNVNIIVQDTINDIEVNAAIIVETIDINVNAIVDEVTIISNPNEYIINVNRIIGDQVQSDWNETDEQAPDYIKNKPTIPAPVTKTSDLINDGEDGINPFITLNDIPPVTGFVPYTGATQDVNLGEFGVQLGNIEFDNTPTNIPTTAGSVVWNDSDGTLNLTLKGGNVTLQVGQEQVLRVVNKTATNVNLLESNYQAVRVTGAQGQRLKVDLAQATNDILSAETIGLVTETINNNQEGFITTSGLVRGINTTGSLQGETWVDGDIIYLSPFTAGLVTKVKPTAPNHLVIIGYVVHAHITQGTIFIKVDNGYELDELHNVKITTPINNNVLGYNSTTEIWENKTIDNVIGYTPFELPSLTNGSVLFSNGTTIAQDNGNLFWDNDNNRLGIGTANPNYPLHVKGDVLVEGASGSETIWMSGGRAVRYNAGFLELQNSIYIDSNNGNVGVGVNIASTKLDVNGVITATGGNSTSWNAKENPLSFSTPLVRNINAISIPKASGGVDGYLDNNDWLIFNDKQEALISGTNIKTINGNTVLGSGNLTISPIATHILSKPISNSYYSTCISMSLTTMNISNSNFHFTAFTPAYDLTIKEIIFQVTSLAVGGLLKAVVYSDLNGVPYSKLLESATVSTDTTGNKTLTNLLYTFTAGNTYWISMISNANVGVRALNTGTFAVVPIIATTSTTSVFTSWLVNSSFTTPPNPFPTPGIGNLSNSTIPYLVFRAN